MATFSVHGREVVVVGAARSGVAAAELARRRGEATADVTSAIALTPAQTQALEEALRSVVGSKVSVDLKVDRSLIGGLVVRVGSRMIDTSLATKLRRLRLAMKGVG